MIGANCLIGNYAFIRPGTIISNGVKIGFATEIKNAVIEAEATIGPQCFIANSVVANRHIWAHKYEPVIIVWMNSPCLFELQMELSLPDAIN